MSEKDKPIIIELSTNNAIYIHYKVIYNVVFSDMCIVCLSLKLKDEQTRDYTYTQLHSMTMSDLNNSGKWVGPVHDNNIVYYRNLRHRDSKPNCTAQ